MKNLLIIPLEIRTTKFTPVRALYIVQYATQSYPQLIILNYICNNMKWIYSEKWHVSSVRKALVLKVPCNRIWLANMKFTPLIVTSGKSNIYLYYNNSYSKIVITTIDSIQRCKIQGKVSSWLSQNAPSYWKTAWMWCKSVNQVAKHLF